MCLLCIELQKGNMRTQDIARNFSELCDTDPKHAEEVAEKFADVISSRLFEDDDFDELSTDPWYFFYNNLDD